MKKTFQYILSALAVILAVSCSQEQMLEGSKNNEPVIITATFDKNGTKSTLAEDGVTPNWSAGDEIWLSDGTNTSTVTVTEAGTTFSFAKPVALTGTTLYAVYPATAAKGVTDGNIGIEIPSYQDGTFASANICVAQTNGTGLSFKNATAILKFTQTTKGVNNIIISAPGISGTASVTYGKSLTVPAVTGKSIYVRANSSPAIYIAVAPATLAVGTKFTFMTADKYLTQSTKADKSLAVNDLVNMGSMDGYSITESLYVDLGLPSGTVWATMNIGATTSTDYGDYFAWGETSPYYDFGYAQEDPQSHWKTGKSAGYTWPSYKYCNGTTTTLTKYCYNSSYGYNGYTDSKTVLDSSDDAATANWNSIWRTPTKAEWEELLNADNCTWEWTQVDGVNGYKVTGKKAGYTDKFIFLPAAGYRPQTFYFSPGSAGSYWSSSLYTSSLGTGDPSNASQLFFNSDSYNINSKSERIIGRSVRPVFVALEGVNISHNNISIFDNQKYSLSVAPVPTNALILTSCVWESSNTEIATVDQNGTVTAVATGTCTISVTAGGYSATCTVTVTHEYVDLGLSVKWATKNVGATKPTDYGDYFAWGEVTPKSDYSDSTYRYCNGSYKILTKYCDNSSYGYNNYTDSKTVLDASDDAASVNWGGSWRMPTKAEQDELRNNCNWQWTNIDGVSGYKVTGKKAGYTDKFIFLPAAGHRDGTDRRGRGSYGHYWSSSLRTSYPEYAFCLNFYSDYVKWYFSHRYHGHPVRPVCK